MASIKEVLVLGCGIAGLTCALTLKEHFPVKIIAAELPPDTTSNVAAAFWYPYRAYPQELVMRWSRATLDKYYEEAADAHTGVSIKNLLEVFDAHPEPPWWQEVLRDFRPAGIDELPAGYSYGLVMTVPVIESGVYISCLMRRFELSGGTVEKLPGPVSRLSELQARGRLIVNCTGLGARQLCNDSSMYPIRGQIVRVEAPGVREFLLDENELTYIVPRSNDCILGGTAQDNDWNLAADAEIAARILDCCRKLVPGLAEARVLEHLVGLRPGRAQVRLEFEQVSTNCTVIHNYGHGGSGFTLCWGCADDVLSLALAV